MEKEILEILKRLESKVDGLEQGQERLENKIDKIDKTLEVVYD
ncbi:MAG: hypothetical protein ACRC68_07360 [Clostridium sp.]